MQPEKDIEIQLSVFSLGSLVYNSSQIKLIKHTPLILDNVIL